MVASPLTAVSAPSTFGILCRGACSKINQIGLFYDMSCKNSFIIYFFKTPP